MKKNKNISLICLFIFVFILTTLLFSFLIRFVLPAVFSFWVANIVYLNAVKGSFKKNITKEI
ncbi:hypothetical protein N9N24_00835 [Candidatus Marinimicrobia bacterium]|nr:hypothetical protein [Candidatus Neomarinimicrobiota bacterium]